MKGIRFQLAGAFRSARALRLSEDLKVSRTGAATEFILPSLADYELIRIR